ncbi:hypothetical protein AMAG_16157 [Allomyces macrogynus ATCC 38327]|uniref:SCP domain-containing protein n=1 Tax=Allomyces macrogynus (strain ATCC 38327) TaxID=578462 RepID=A0A0L0TA70_ALLM3|nr:hypothetical protein AMAG_16157 [Allomyces macrogynus ATCC 38327]|eukprot:KNE71595.1 hypothetical protein AMAG_16157 [Allomyces macrogynus ATCC 38327]
MAADKVSILALLALVAATAVAGAPTTAAPSAVLTDYQVDALRLINEHRATASKPALCLEPHLLAAAERHAKDMAGGRYLGHVGSDKSQLKDRLDAAGYQYSLASENIVFGSTGNPLHYEAATAAVQRWIASPVHEPHMVNAKYNQVGVARALGACPSSAADAAAAGTCAYWTVVYAEAAQGASQACIDVAHATVKAADATSTVAATATAAAATATDSASTVAASTALTAPAGLGNATNNAPTSSLTAEMAAKIQAEIAERLKAPQSAASVTYTSKLSQDDANKIIAEVAAKLAEKQGTPVAAPAPAAAALTDDQIAHIRAEITQKLGAKSSTTGAAAAPASGLSDAEIKRIQDEIEQKLAATTNGGKKAVEPAAAATPAPAAQLSDAEVQRIRAEIAQRLGTGAATTSTGKSSAPSGAAAVTDATPSVIQSTTTAAAQNATATGTELQVLLNARRRRHSAGDLCTVESLAKTAQLHAEFLAQAAKDPAHTGSNGSTLADRLAAQGYPASWAAELLAAGTSPAFLDEAQVFDLWVDTPDHKSLMEAAVYNNVGIGHAQGKCPASVQGGDKCEYWVLLLGQSTLACSK